MSEEAVQRALATETSRKVSELVAQAAKDATLRQKLLNNPAPVLREHGIDLPPGSEVRIVKDPAAGPYLEVKAGAGVTELTGDQLGSVVGGSTSGSQPIEFLKIKLTEVFVSAYH